MTILGAVLAGGRSRRFGRDKGAALLDGRTLIDHAVAALVPHVDAVVLVGRDDPAFSCTRDRPAPGLGPLGGIAGALHHAARHGHGAVLTLPCDAPHFPDAALQRLLAAGGPALLAQLPVCGLWPTVLGPGLDAWLVAGGDGSVRRWAASVGARPVDVGDLSLPNVNTPDDLARYAGEPPIQDDPT